MRAERERRRRAAGFTLVETIIFIVIVGAALAGVLAVLNVTASRSADPFLMKQSLAIGEAFIDEILSRDYANAAVYTTSPPVDPRSNYADVDDYNLYAATGITTRAGAAIAGLALYRVSVAVAAEAAIGGANMKAITVTVTDPSGRTYPSTAYKADY